MDRSGFNQIVFIRMKINLDPDLMASSEANWCRCTLFTKRMKLRLRRTKVSTGTR